jgi:glucosamine 6-phosphate synthetase-like amidotransferase/phosphosugar isomerase protein
MCGIMGYYAFGKKLPDKDKLTTMFIDLQSRGRDAAGFAYVKDNALVVAKKAVPSVVFVQEESWQNLELPKILIAHTRLGTQGAATNNMNNHPLFSKNGVAVVHNGIIYNDREIFGKEKRDAEVDSESILHILASKHKGDKLEKLFHKLAGSYSVAVIETSNPDRLTLIKKDNPLDLLFDTNDDILYFCSELDIIKRALAFEDKLYRGFNLGNLGCHTYEMSNQHALVVDNDEVELYREYKTRHAYSYPREIRKPKKIKKSRTTASAEVRWDEDSEQVECPWCCNLTTINYGMLRNVCEVCGLEIEENDFEDEEERYYRDYYYS